MPLYDFKCLDCGLSFEALVLRQLDAPACPGCGKQNLEQLLSTFSVNSENTRQATLRAGKSKNAKMLRDQKMDQIAAERDHHH